MENNFENNEMKCFENNEKKIFFQQIFEIPRLKNKEALELIKEIKDIKVKKENITEKDKNKLLENEQKLILSFLKLVYFLANKYHKMNNKIEFYELIQEGSLELINAVDRIEKFDPETGNEVSTFLGSLIKFAMIRTFYKNEGFGKNVPIYVVENREKYYKIIQQLELDLERLPTIEEIASKIKKTKETTLSIINALDN